MNRASRSNVPAWLHVGLGTSVHCTFDRVRTACGRMLAEGERDKVDEHYHPNPCKRCVAMLLKRGWLRSERVAHFWRIASDGTCSSACGRVSNLPEHVLAAEITLEAHQHAKTMDRRHAGAYCVRCLKAGG